MPEQVESDVRQRVGVLFEYRTNCVIGTSVKNTLEKQVIQKKKHLKTQFSNSSPKHPIKSHPNPTFEYHHSSIKNRKKGHGVA